VTALVPAVFDATVLGPMRHSMGRTLLAMTAIGLGVALGFAIHLINRVAADEVSLAARSLFGQADLAVEADGVGFDERLYPVVARLPGIEVASPVVQVEAKLPGRRGALTLLGTDAFRAQQMQPAFAELASAPEHEDDDATRAGEPVYLSASAARDLDVTAGDTLSVQVGLQQQEFVVAGVLPASVLEDRAGVIDIATAQWRFERLGKLSRINVKIVPGSSLAAAREQLARVLPMDVRVTTPEQAASDATRLSRSYRSNLTALALVALFTGGFFVYSTQSLASLRRRREFALLHALGLTRGQQLAALLTSGAIIGAVGAVVGVAAGLALAQFAVAALGGELGAGYFSGIAPSLELRWAEAIAFGALGLVVAIAGTLQPAFEASKVPTAAALKAADLVNDTARSHGTIVSLLLGCSLAALLLPPVAGLPLPGYVSIGLFIIATVAAMPALLQWLLARAPRWRAVAWEIAVSHLRGTARQATLSVTAIVVSFTLMVAMAIMVMSFRGSLDTWMQRLLPADIYLRAGYIGQSAHFAATDADALRDESGVARLQGSRFARATSVEGQQTLVVIARDMDVAHPERALWMERSARTALPPAAVPIWISQPIADAFALDVGSNFRFAIQGREVSANVRGIWRDYEHVRGAIVMERSRYVTLTGDTALNTLSLWVDDGVSPQQVQTRIRSRLGGEVHYDMRTPRELREMSLQAFDRAFAVTYLLEIIAIVIGLCGIAAGTSAQVLARRREFGVLRHIGLSRAQIAATLAIEGAGLGVLGVVVGLISGSLVSLVLIHVVNRQSFHWTMDFQAPYGALALLSAILICASSGIAVLSGRQAMRGDVVAAVKEDW
jgi:putative ABC transport system permease protein